MGSFNTKCFASGQTIAPGDPCYVLPIRRSHDYEKVDVMLGEQPFSIYGLANSTCYPHAFWNLAGDFLEAKYDDCGNFNFVNTKITSWRMTTFILELYNENLVVAQGENRFHDVPFDLVKFITEKMPTLHKMFAPAPADKEPKAEMTEDERAVVFNELCQVMEYLLDTAHQHRLFTDHYNEPFPLEFAVIHGAAFEGLIKLAESGKTWEGGSWERRALFERAFAKLSEPMSEDDVKELEAAKAAGDQEEVGFLERCHLSNQDSNFRSEFMRAGQMEGLAYPGYSSAIHHIVRDYRKNGSTCDAMFTRMRPFLDSQYVLAGLRILNLRLTPMVYSSQDYENEIGGKYADFVQKTSTEITKARKDRYGDDEEDEDRGD